MSEPNKDGTDIMMALLMGLSGPRASKAWNESQQIKAESFLTMAEHWINQTAEENARLKAEVDRLAAFTTRTIIPNEQLQAEVERLTKQNALSTPRHLIASQDIKTLREQIEELKLENSQYEEHHKYGQNVITSLREEVERLTKAVMHSPAAQLKLKELEGKTTFEEINPKDDNSNITTELLVLCNRQASDIRRLTKAGDAMSDQLLCDYGDNHLTYAWFAAKEGKPSRD
jgi:leucyl-tRNA synthetase